jgi:hypothetical protein
MVCIFDVCILMAWRLYVRLLQVLSEERARRQHAMRDLADAQVSSPAPLPNSYHSTLVSAPQMLAAISDRFYSWTCRCTRLTPVLTRQSWRCLPLLPQEALGRHAVAQTLTVPDAAAAACGVTAAVLLDQFVGTAAAQAARMRSLSAANEHLKASTFRHDVLD